MKSFMMLGVVAVFATGCIIVDYEEMAGGHTRDWDAQLATLYAASVDQHGIVIRAASGGCTGKDSFDVDVDQDSDASVMVSFTRTQDDVCQAMLPGGVELMYSRAELGIPAHARITVRNHVGG